MLTANCTHIVRAEAIIINFPAKLNFNAFAAAEMKMKIASIGKIAKKSSGCCALECVYDVCVCVCIFGELSTRLWRSVCRSSLALSLA